jgi:hypothetical protein
MFPFCTRVISLTKRVKMYVITRVEFASFMNNNDLSYFKFQRNIDENHVDSIMDFQQLQYNKTGEYKFIHPIIIGSYDNTNKHIVLDGQHRIEVIKKLVNNFNIIVQVIQLKDEKEAYANIKLINTHKPYVQLESNYISLVDKKLLKYKSFISSATKRGPQVPNFNINIVDNLLNKNSKWITSEFIKEMDILSDFIRTNWISMSISKKSFDKALSKTGPTFYLGLMRNNSWLDAIIIKMRGTNYCDIEYSSYPFKLKRYSISSSVKDKLWRTHSSNKCEALCYIGKCGTVISYRNFKVGHVKSVFDGGSSDIDNLRCICHDCNVQMATQNLEEYKKSL